VLARLEGVDVVEILGRDVGAVRRIDQAVLNSGSV
jgi:hypothetical protein